MKCSRPRFLPFGISLYITYQCHLKCGHCFLVQTDLLNKHELSFEKIKSIIDDAYQHNVFLLILSGGEPLLHSGFSEIIEYARSKSILPLLGITVSNSAQ